MANCSRKSWARYVPSSLALFLLLAGCWLAGRCGGTTAVALQTEPTPTADPLAIPELPPDPTQVDIGRVSYYYNCMPCHGDHGQGLTEAWRQTWVEDHRNCWDRGCHAGRAGDEGFPLPRVIPAVAGAEADLTHFTSAQALHDYLQETHPPQRPGVLPDADYWALTAFLLAENGQPPQQDQGPEPAAAVAFGWTAVLATAALVLAALAFFRARRRRAGAARKELTLHDHAD